MKLVDILARDMKSWPTGVPQHGGMVQTSAGGVYYVAKNHIAYEVFVGKFELADDWVIAHVLIEHWQAARDALGKLELFTQDRGGNGLRLEVLRLFLYDPKTGSLKWKENQQKRFIGREAGFINHHGYRRVNIGKTKLHAHQIIWLMQYGELPECEIDHINGIRDDNRLENLRLATQQKNQQNAGLRIDNALGVKGVRLRPSGNYQARVKLSDGSRAVKTFCTAIEAVSWLAMQREISHGEYANTPEQIAAEEKAKAIEEIRRDTGYILDETCAAAVLAAGYRKRVAP